MTLRFLVDSNIFSEPTRPRPDPGVTQRLTEEESFIAIATPVIHELRFGIELLPDSARRRALEWYLDDVILKSFESLPYCRKSADWHALERARLRRQGRNPGIVDGQIAAIAATHGLILVTRNVRDFDGFRDLQVENWFTEDA